MKNIVTFLVVALAAGSIFGAPYAFAADPIRVGVVACLSGGCAEWGTATRNGLTLAQADINSSGGVLGRKIKLKF